MLGIEVCLLVDDSEPGTIAAFLEIYPPMACEDVRLRGFLVDGQLGREVLSTAEGLGCRAFDATFGCCEEAPLGFWDGICCLTALASMTAASDRTWENLKKRTECCRRGKAEPKNSA